VRHHLRQIVAGNVLHYQKLAIAFPKVIAHAWQSWMMHARQQARFALKLASQALIGKQRFLQRDGRVEPLVNSFVNSAHATLAELLNYAIAILQDQSGGEHQCFFRYNCKSGSTL
jgi:hypothetical protein